MAGSLNKVQLIGNLGADPEIRHTQDGRPIANFRMAMSETWRDKNTGEKREATEWVTVVCFNEALCKVIEQYVKKGDKVYVEGRLQTRKWQDKEGNDRYSTEVVMQGFDSKLVMLSSRQDPGRSDYSSHDRGYGRSGGDDESQDRGQRSGGGYAGAKAGPAASGGQSKGGFDKKMDDEIPF